MKILHSSDWHLGKTIANKKLIDYQLSFFEKEFIPLIKELTPDLLIVSGDIVDKPNPDYETLKGYKEVLHMIASTGVPTLFILGNHDSKRISLFKEFLELGRIYLVDDLSFFLKPFVWETSEEKVYFYVMPYLSVFELISKVKEIFPKETSKLLEEKSQVFTLDLLSLLFSKLELTKPAVFVGHLAVDSAVFSGEEVSKSRWQLTLGNEEVLPTNLLSRFDLSLLGHLHRLQSPAPKVLYSGSPLPYSFEEAGYQKGIWFIKFEKENFTAEPYFLDPPYRLKTYEGYFKDLMLKRDESFVRVVLKDETPVPHPYERLRKVFPNLIELRYEKPVEPQEKDFSLLDVNNWALDKGHALDEKELFRKFYRFVEGKEVEAYLFEAFVGYLKEFAENQEKKL
ncbi:exonuclease SbcCD subunit D [Thermodesulfobacterium sp. TA1]|uniref:exonuclease SbcCD subunit D n=1 Tax=Thermodesulfobacterium sp. TA1 TaxID=2234087 RepID=UPI001231FABF|nr:exonuclease SbcCD subunit D [Thermodesulfobacterium sp. TA1]QER41271.1 exonuclease SbcCD subunit D [Thermodesulfobacterium sp. TA1]